jgi:hypothetical protein
MDMEKIEEREPEFARLAIKGNGVGAILSMNTAFNLSEDGGGTKMDWEAEVRIAGPVGSMGQRVLQPIVNQQVQHVLGALDEQVQKTQSESKSAAGSSGADEGLSPLAPESYEPEPQGPTTSTED